MLLFATFSRLRPLRVAALSLLLLPAACGSANSGAAPPPTAVSDNAGGGIQVAVASNDLTVGQNRFTFGLLKNDHPVERNAVRVVFFLIHGNTATVEQSMTATFNRFAKGLKDTDANSAAVQIGGVYVAHPTFHQAGRWGLEVRMPGGGSVPIRQEFPVLQHSLTPAVGSRAPRSHNPTVAQMPASKLDSGHPPDDMHKLSIAQAIGQHKPLVVLFATPGYCTSRMCGPETQIVEQLEHRYRGRVNFIHIEIYKDANPAHGYAPTVLAWHLQTEPWVFVVNRRGIINAKFEGPTAGSEIAPAIQATL